MTNGEKIRKMSDEELAKMLSNKIPIGQQQPLKRALKYFAILRLFRLKSEFVFETIAVSK